jgi:hypothetical protein
MRLFKNLSDRITGFFKIDRIYLVHLVNLVILSRRTAI